MKVAALLLAMALPAQAATLTVPEYHTFTQYVPGGITSFGGLAGGESHTLNLVHLGKVTGSYQFTASWFADMPIVPFTGEYTVRTYGDGQTVTFEVLDDTDTFYYSSNVGLHNGRSRIVQTVSTPLPGSLYLLALGLGMLSILVYRVTDPRRAK